MHFILHSFRKSFTINLTVKICLDSLEILHQEGGDGFQPNLVQIFV